jgi:hypothetical protein
MYGQMAKIVAITIGLFPVDTCYYSNSSTCFSRISRRRRKVRIVETIETLLGVYVSLNPTRFVKHPILVTASRHMLIGPGPISLGASYCIIMSFRRYFAGDTKLTLTEHAPNSISHIVLPTFLAL